MIGEALFPKIAKYQPDLAGKITGMMIEEGLDRSELQNTLENEQQMSPPLLLEGQINEAMRMLARAGARAPAEPKQAGAPPPATWPQDTMMIMLPPPPHARGPWQHAVPSQLYRSMGYEVVPSQAAPQPSLGRCRMRSHRRRAVAATMTAAP